MVFILFQTTGYLCSRRPKATHSVQTEVSRYAVGNPHSSQLRARRIASITSRVRRGILRERNDTLHIGIGSQSLTCTKSVLALGAPSLPCSNLYAKCCRDIRDFGYCPSHFTAAPRPTRASLNVSRYRERALFRGSCGPSSLSLFTGGLPSPSTWRGEKAISCVLWGGADRSVNTHAP